MPSWLMTPTVCMLQAAAWPQHGREAMKNQDKRRRTSVLAGRRKTMRALSSACPTWLNPCSACFSCHNAPPSAAGHGPLQSASEKNRFRHVVAPFLCSGADALHLPTKIRSGHVAKARVGTPPSGRDRPGDMRGSRFLPVQDIRRPVQS
jgi:hypothetical protein